MTTTTNHLTSRSGARLPAWLNPIRVPTDTQGFGFSRISWLPMTLPKAGLPTIAPREGGNHFCTGFPSAIPANQPLTSKLYRLGERPRLAGRIPSAALTLILLLILLLTLSATFVGNLCRPLTI